MVSLHDENPDRFEGSFEISVATWFFVTVNRFSAIVIWFSAVATWFAEVAVWLVNTV